MSLAPRGALGMSLAVTLALRRTARIFILNNLLVAPREPGKGFAKLLLASACDYGRSVRAVRLSLSTAVENDRAKQLYERAGWIRDNQFCGYTISLI